LELCLWVVVVWLLVAGFDEELPALPPHAASATVAARAATSVSMAVSGVLLIGRAAI